MEPRTPMTATGLEFPVAWDYRIIASARPGLPADIQRTLLMFGFQCSVRQTNESKGGRYVTYTVTVTLRDRLMLTQVTHAISKIEGVRLVL